MKFLPKRIGGLAYFEDYIIKAFSTLANSKVDFLSDYCERATGCFQLDDRACCRAYWVEEAAEGIAGLTNLEADGSDFDRPLSLYCGPFCVLF